MKGEIGRILQEMREGKSWPEYMLWVFNIRGNIINILKPNNK